MLLGAQARLRAQTTGHSPQKQPRRLMIVASQGTKPAGQMRQAPRAAQGASSRRQLLAGVAAAAALLAGPRSSRAVGIESLDLPLQLPTVPPADSSVLDAAEEEFLNSELLATLKERTEANRDK